LLPEKPYPKSDKGMNPAPLEPLFYQATSDPRYLLPAKAEMKRPAAWLRVIIRAIVLNWSLLSYLATSSASRSGSVTSGASHERGNALAAIVQCGSAGRAIDYI